MRHITKLLRDIHAVYLETDAATIRGLLQNAFHNDMVIRGPEFALIAQGKEACIASYVAFARAATVLLWKATEPQIELFDDMAVAKYHWEMRYESAGKTCEQSGNDVVMCILQGDTWLAAWRALGAER